VTAVRLLRTAYGDLSRVLGALTADEVWEPTHGDALMGADQGQLMPGRPNRGHWAA
jgi:hypothetical protein